MHMLSLKGLQQKPCRCRKRYRSNGSAIVAPAPRQREREDDTKRDATTGGKKKGAGVAALKYETGWQPRVKERKGE